MKEPLIKECPCCSGTLLDYAYKAICENVITDVDGELVRCDLYWECIRCGCKWKHGQFQTVDQDKEDKAEAILKEQGLK